MVYLFIRSICMVLSITILSTTAYPDSLPARDLNPSYLFANMTQNEFIETIEDVISIYRPIVESMQSDPPVYNVKLHVYPEWNNNEVNAYADRVHAHWHIWIKGGLGRHYLITRLGLIAVVCHELGHFLGGYPQKNSPNTWSSAEAQADYFAGMVCMRKVFAKFADKYNDGKAWKYCSGLNDSDRLICDLTLSAAKSEADLLSYYYKPKIIPDYDNPDQTVVNQTIIGYPNPQCRLDSFFSGAFCFKNWDDSVIPKTTDAVCKRPQCWYSYD